MLVKKVTIAGTTRVAIICSEEEGLVLHDLCSGTFKRVSGKGPSKYIDFLRSMVTGCGGTDAGGKKRILPTGSNEWIDKE